MSAWWVNKISPFKTLQNICHTCLLCDKWEHIFTCAVYLLCKQKGIWFPKSGQQQNRTVAWDRHSTGPGRPRWRCRAWDWKCTRRTSAWKGANKEKSLIKYACYFPSIYLPVPQYTHKWDTKTHRESMEETTEAGREVTLVKWQHLRLTQTSLPSP